MFTIPGIDSQSSFFFRKFPLFLPIHHLLRLVGWGHSSLPLIKRIKHLALKRLLFFFCSSFEGSLAWRPLRCLPTFHTAHNPFAIFWYATCPWTMVPNRLSWFNLYEIASLVQMIYKTKASQNGKLETQISKWAKQHFPKHVSCESSPFGV